MDNVYLRTSGRSRISLRWGVPTLRGGLCQHTILPNFPKNCMKLKEFGPGGHASLTPTLDPPLTTFYEKLMTLNIGRSKGGAGMCPLPGGPNSFILVHFSAKKLEK